MESRHPAHDSSRFALLLLAGGAGTRLWPLSTRERPKQFVAFAGSTRTMLQAAWDDVPAFVPRGQVFVNVARGFESVARAQLPDLAPGNLIVAPEERNTLPICGYATAAIEEQVPGATVLVVAADTHIGTRSRYHDALLDCFVAAQAGAHIVALGVRSTYASTQYGYMHVGERAPVGQAVHYGRGYLEKPSREVAERLHAGGAHDWNTGAFAWDAAVFFEACRLHAPAHAVHFDRLREGGIAGRDADDLARIMARLPAQDIDRGLMERLSTDAGDTPRLLLVRGTFEWDDLGTLTALERLLPSDANGNRWAGSVRAGTARRCTLVAEPPVRLDVEDVSGTLVVAAAHGDVVVCPVADAPLVPSLAQQPLWSGLAEGADGRLAVSDAVGTNRVRGAVRLSACSGVTVENDGPGVTVVHGMTDCRVAVRGADVSVRPSPAGDAAAGAPPSWVTVDADHEAMSQRAVGALLEDLRALLDERPEPVLVLSAGRTPVRIYDLLVRRHRDALDWGRFLVVQMDEYVPRHAGDAGIFRRFLLESVIGPLGMRHALLDGTESAAALAAHEARIDGLGGIGLVLHGVGVNGHLGFNEPGSAIDAPARRVELAPGTRPTGMAPDRTPTHGLTLGLRQLTDARRVRLVASGAAKRAAIHGTLLASPTDACPASSLQGHPDVQVFLDRAACHWLGP